MLDAGTGIFVDDTMRGGILLTILMPDDSGADGGEADGLASECIIPDAGLLPIVGEGWLLIAGADAPTTEPAESAVLPGSKPPTNLFATIAGFPIDAGPWVMLICCGTVYLGTVAAGSLKCCSVDVAAAGVADAPDEEVATIAGLRPNLDVLRVLALVVVIVGPDEETIPSVCFNFLPFETCLRLAKVFL